MKRLDDFINSTINDRIVRFSRGSEGIMMRNSSKFTCNNRTIRGHSNQITGDDNIITGHSNTIYGKDNSISGNSNVVYGNDNTVDGNSNKAVGNDNTLTGLSNTANGKDNKVDGRSTSKRQRSGSISAKNVCITGGIHNFGGQEYGNTIINGVLQTSEHERAKMKEDILRELEEEKAAVAAVMAAEEKEEKKKKRIKGKAARKRKEEEEEEPDGKDEIEMEEKPKKKKRVTVKAKRKGKKDSAVIERKKISPDMKDTPLPEGADETLGCKVCLGSKIATVVIDCSHSYMCPSCARLEPADCAICRKPIVEGIIPRYDG